MTEYFRSHIARRLKDHFGEAKCCPRAFQRVKPGIRTAGNEQNRSERRCQSATSS